MIRIDGKLYEAPSAWMSADAILGMVGKSTKTHDLYLVSASDGKRHIRPVTDLKNARVHVTSLSFAGMETEVKPRSEVK